MRRDRRRERAGAGRIASAILLAALLALGTSTPAPPLPLQQPPAAAGSLRVRVGAAPGTITIGDRFEATVVVRAAPGVRVEAGAVEERGVVQQLGAARRVERPAAGEVGFVYPLTAWKTGALPRTEVVLRVTEPGSPAREARVALRLPRVRSVLPPDDSVAPRAARGIIAAEAAPWWAALALAALLAAAALVWRARRVRLRRAAAERGEPLDPRVRALEELRQISAREPATPAEARALVAAAAAVLRHLLAAWRAEWTDDLSSRELLASVRSAGDLSLAESLEPLLARADRAKFAPDAVRPSEAREYVARLLEWVEDVAPALAPAVVPAPRAAEAPSERAAS